MTSVVTKTGKRKTYKDYDMAVAGYSTKKGFVELMHKRTGKKRLFKL